jgi:protein phosphatase 1L
MLDYTAAAAHTPPAPASHNPPPQKTPDEDTHIVIASDGLFNEELRGGGGGLDNDTVAELCIDGLAAGTSCNALAEAMSTAAQRVGSTDDVTVVVVRLK